MTQLDRLADDLAVSGRSLRRAANLGLIRAERPRARKLVLPLREEDYVRNYWPTLSMLRQLFRTQHNVRLAVLFGSVARGDAGAGSDLDLFVALRDDNYRRRFELRELIRDAVGRQVDLLSWDGAAGDAALLYDVLREGRVLLDRDDHWAQLGRKREQVRKAAARETRQLLADETAALDGLRAASP
jgi:predicted nucleotidyltransferase